MSIHFEKLTVKDIRKETADCVSIAFQIPANLSSHFVFKQGQYITLRTNILGADVRRSYSICSSPLENELRVAVKKVAGGLFSTFANEQLQIGDRLDVMPPIGRFHTDLNPKNKNAYVAFAAGSGITPVLSIIKTTLATEPNSFFTLVYGNKNRHSIIFKEELETLKNRYLDRFKIIHLLSREKTDTPINHGRIDAEKLNILSKHLIDIPSTDAYFLCGPEEMVLTIKNELLAKQVPLQKIHIELFTTQLNTEKKVSRQIVNNSTSTTSEINIKLDGISFEFRLGFDGQSILDAALQNGADLPFACKGGVCCTCKAKLLGGEVEMDVNYGLEPDEIEQGYILTCQSHPRTSKVFIDFDAK